MYILSCSKCSTVREFKRRKKMRDFGRTCPVCGGALSQLPLPRFTITMLSDMHTLSRSVEVIRMDDGALERFKDWLRVGCRR